MATDRPDAAPLTAAGRRFVVDASWQRFRPGAGRSVSPLRIFRVTERGAETLAAIERRDHVAPSRLVDRLLDGGAIHPSFAATSRVGGPDALARRSRSSPRNSGERWPRTGGS